MYRTNQEGRSKLRSSTGRHFEYMLTPENIRNNPIQCSIPKPIPSPHLNEHGQASPSLPVQFSTSALFRLFTTFSNTSLLAPATPSGISLRLKRPLHTSAAPGAIFNNAARKRLYFAHSDSVRERKGRRLLVPACRMMGLMEGENYRAVCSGVEAVEDIFDLIAALAEVYG